MNGLLFPADPLPARLRVAVAGFLSLDVPHAPHAPTSDAVVRHMQHGASETVISAPFRASGAVFRATRARCSLILLLDTCIFSSMMERTCWTAESLLALAGWWAGSLPSITRERESPRSAAAGSPASAPRLITLSWQRAPMSSVLHPDQAAIPAQGRAHALTLVRQAVVSTAYFSAIPRSAFSVLKSGLAAARLVT